MNTTPIEYKEVTLDDAVESLQTISSRAVKKRVRSDSQVQRDKDRMAKVREAKHLKKLAAQIE